MGSKSPTQTTTTNTPPPQVLQEYGTVTNRANQVANTPYTPYNGPLVAPVNDQQNTGIGGVNNYANAAQPYLTGAAGLTLAGAGPANAQQFSPGAVNQYLSPYTQDVVNATQAAFQNQNTQQAQQLEGNTIGAGAFGGDRAGVAQGILAGQQQTAEAPVIAGLYNQGYSQALGEFNTQQSTNLSAEQANLARLQAAGLQYGNIGTASQTAGLQGAGAQLQAGTLQQQTQQAADTAAYNQFLQAQAFPYQQTQFQANIAEGIGSNSGGTSTSSTSAPNSAAPYIGAGLGLLALSPSGSSSTPAAHGGRIMPRYAGGGLVIDARHRFAGGGGLVMPYADNEQNEGSWIPQTQAPALGHTIPTAQAPANSNNQTAQGLGSITSGLTALGNSGIGDAVTDFVTDALPAVLAFANGGLVMRRGYDDGGMASPYGALVDVDPGLQQAQALAASGAPLPPPRPAGLMAPPSNSLDTATVAPTPAAPTGQPIQLSGAGGLTTSGLNPDARGMRNNNPGNLESNAWTSSLPGYAGTDGRFAIFSSPQQGMAALDRNLQGYGDRGISTPLQIASTWAPASDNNNPASYGTTIARALGVGLNDKIDLSDPSVRAKVGQAIGLVENGVSHGTPPTAAAYAPGGAGGGLTTGPSASPAAAAIQDQTSPAAPQQNNGGLFGLHLSDPVRAGLLSAAFGIMASPSRNLAMAIGQGGQQGVATYEKALDQARQQMLTKSEIANYNSEIANRPQDIAVRSRALDIQAANASSEIGLRTAQLPGIAAESNVKVAQGAMQTEVMNNYLRQHGQQPIAGASNPAPTGSPANPSVTSAATSPVTAATAPAPRTAPAGPSPAPGAPQAGGQFPPGRSPADVDPRDDPMALRATADQYSMVPALTDQANRLYAQAAVVMSGGQQVRFKDGTTGYYPGVGEAKAGQAAHAAQAEGEAKVASDIARAAGIENYKTQIGARTQAASEAETGQAMLSQAQAMRDVMFDPQTGAARVNTGPLGPLVSKVAALAEQAGVSPKITQWLTGTNPDDSQSLEKFRTALGSESARQDLPGSQVRVSEFQRYLASVPSNEILPTAFKYLLDTAIVPKAQQQIGAYQAVKDLDPSKDNIQGTLFSYRQQHPWYDPAAAAAARPGAAAQGQPTTGAAPSAPAKLSAANPEADYAALPRGAHFVGPDGQERIKP